MKRAWENVQPKVVKMSWIFLCLFLLFVTLGVGVIFGGKLGFLLKINSSANYVCFLILDSWDLLRLDWVNCFELICS